MCLVVAPAANTMASSIGRMTMPFQQAEGVALAVEDIAGHQLHILEPAKRIRDLDAEIAALLQ